MPLGLPYIGGSTASQPATANAADVQSMPLYVEIASTPRPDGSYNVSWSITLPAIPGVSPQAISLAGGSLLMLGTDKFVKLLVQIRAAYLNVLQSLQMNQILPAYGSGNPNAGGSFYHCLPVDMIAGLPDSPRIVGQ